MKHIFTVIKKELKRFFTDKRMLISLFLPGVVIFALYSLLGEVVGDMLAPSEDYVYKIAINVENEPYSGQTFLELDTLVDYEKVLVQNAEDGKNRLANGEVDLFVEYTPSQGEVLETFSLYFNSVSMESSNVYSTFSALLAQKSAHFTPIFYVNSIDTSTEDDISNMMMSMIVPMLLVLFLFTGAISVAPESIAGEKERGTIATLLVTPVKRSYIAIGKVIALSITALASGLVSFTGFALSLPKLLSADMGVDISISLELGFKEYATLLLVVCLTVITITVLLSIISTFAKSVKEASSYASPLLLLVMALSIVGTFAGDGISEFVNLIPLYNSISLVDLVLKQAITPLSVIFFTLSNVVVIGGGIILLAKMFNSEKIMFNK